MTNKINENSISKALLSQFNRHWDMLKQAIENYPDEEWGKDEGEWTFSYIIFHIIETTKFYIANSPDEMNWGARAGIDWEKDSKEKIAKAKIDMSKKFLSDYMNEIKEKTTELLENISEEELTNTDSFQWFKSILEKLIYLLRHNSVHLGELSKTLRDEGFERMIWR